MPQVYLSNEADIQRCRDSMVNRTSITITGLNWKGQVEAFTGIVESIEGCREVFRGYRWRATISD